MKPPDPRFERTNVPNRVGLPAPKRYEWRVKERQREREVEQELAEIRALLRSERQATGYEGLCGL